MEHVPIKRYIQKYIETPIAQKIIASQITHKANITVVDDDFIVTVNKIKIADSFQQFLFLSNFKSKYSCNCQ